jgi:D-alanyl-D-alanine dipeptidase
MSYFGFIFSISSESIKPAQVFQRLFIGLFLSLPFYPFPSRAEVPLQCSGLELVSLNRISPRPLFEIRYASSNNFLGRTLYSKVDPQLRCPVALALQKVQQDLSKEGLGLKVWDAHRPLAVQQLMWDEIQDPRYVSDPSVNAGRHTRGASVDVTLVNQRGKPLRMPTDYDDFSKSAHVNADGVLADRAANAQRLLKAMERRGFRSFATEWWHFDWHHWKSMPVIPPS